MNLKKIVIILFVSFGLLAFLFTGYAKWNSANPDKTCASCHEISPSVDEWHNSAHRNIRCTQCHGTALSNGFHSLKEKARMVLTHWGTRKNPEDIYMTEQQGLDLSMRCAGCHESEYAKWLSGGHSANYADIFMNGKHNQMEAPYWSCLRCHGMYYEGNIKTLLEKPKTKDGVWKLSDMKKAIQSTIPCLSCHNIHGENEPHLRTGRYDDPKEFFYDRKSNNPSVSFYVRADKRHIRADRLMTIEMTGKNGEKIKVSADPAGKLCLQCHSPNFSHEAGSQDDLTPTGVHEGISCVACHAPHSNDARNSCKNCHPAISNCGLEVTKMNTTFADKKSPNNIHSVSCRSCHADVSAMRAKSLKKHEMQIQGKSRE